MASYEDFNKLVNQQENDKTPEPDDKSILVGGFGLIYGVLSATAILGGLIWVNIFIWSNIF